MIARNPPAPDVIAAEIIEDLRAALVAFEELQCARRASGGRLRAALGSRLRRERQADVPHAEGVLMDAPAES
jgi:hypothetical protein